MFWSNLFKKKDKENNTNIANISYVNMPTYDELTTEEQEYVNKLKEECLSFYDTEDNYISQDKELFNEIKVYPELVMDIMLKDHFGDIASSIIDSKKLIYYAHRFNEINNTLKYKYIALNEIKKDKKYLVKHMGLYVIGKRKINILKAIDYQIKAINSSYVITNQKIYEYSAKAIANYPKNIDEAAKKELEKRYKEVEKDYKDLFNYSIDFNNNLNTDDKIAYIEILIDKFIYENKDLIDKLKEQLDLIANSEIKDENIKQEIIDNLMKIKMYYNIFNKYSRNKLTKEDFEDLYQIIFNVYTYFNDANKFQEYYHKLSAVKDVLNSNEISYYNNIISYKMELIKNKKSVIFQRYPEDDDKISSTVINYIDEGCKIIAKNQKNNSLQNKNYFIVSKFLNLILSFDDEYGLELYFKNLKPIKPDSSYEQLKGDDFLKTYIGIMKYINSEPKIIKQIKNGYRAIEEDFILELNNLTENSNIKYLAKLYNLICKPDLNILPNGWKSKQYNVIDLLKYYDFDKNRSVIFPQDEKILFINCNDTDLTKVILPEKMDILGIYVNPYEKIDLNYIILPLNLNDFNIYFFSNNKFSVRSKNTTTPNFCDVELNWNDFDSIIKVFAKIGSLFILREEILNKSDAELYNYLKNIFSSIKYKISPCPYVYLVKYFLIWKTIFENLSIIDKNGIIRKIDLGKKFEQYIDFYNYLKLQPDNKLEGIYPEIFWSFFDALKKNNKRMQR